MASSTRKSHFRCLMNASSHLAKIKQLKECLVRAGGINRRTSRSSVLSLRQNPVQEFEAGIEDRLKGVDQVRVGGKERW